MASTRPVGWSRVHSCLAGEKGGGMGINTTASDQVRCEPRSMREACGLSSLTYNWCTPLCALDHPRVHISSRGRSAWVRDKSIYFVKTKRRQLSPYTHGGGMGCGGHSQLISRIFVNMS
ncbi:uncharacterized protein LOC143422204 [Xylocopa sonorina]|uniref:uncharacterized protein LOC143422204 n=1 Tax=Xylocopa sonorina TaxID=1818115 RepID=UPI00403ACDC6